VSKTNINNNDNNRTEIKTIDKLEQLIKEENIQQHYTKEFSPKKQTDTNITPLIIDGTEVANFRRSGFPIFNDIIKICQLAIEHFFNPITVVIDESLQLLVNEKEVKLVNKIINDKRIEIDGILVRLVIIEGHENLTENMLNLANNANSRLLINDNDNIIVPLYKHKFRWLESAPSKWQIKYLLQQTDFELII